METLRWTSIRPHQCRRAVLTALFSFALSALVCPAPHHHHAAAAAQALAGGGIKGTAPGQESTTSGSTLGINLAIKERKQKLYIHIGPHKTGSTYFQEWMQTLGGISPSLVTPSVCGKDPDNGWYPMLADQLCGLGKYEPNIRFRDLCGPNVRALEMALGRVPKEKDIVISTEDFSKCSEEGFGMVREAVGDRYDVYVVGVKRESRSLYLSRFHQVHKDYEKPDSVWDAVSQLRDLQSSLCTYMSVACVRALGRVFGADKVVTVSYEGMEVAGKELVGVFCDEFSKGPSSGCFRPRQNADLNHNKSPQHEKFSAVGLYNRLRILMGCVDRLDGSLLFKPLVVSTGGEGLPPPRLPRSVVKLVFGEDLDGGLTRPRGKLTMLRFLVSWMRELRDAKVPMSCVPLTALPAMDCDACFHEEVRRGSLPGRHLYYEGGPQHAKPSEQICEFDEAAVWQSPETLRRLVAKVRSIASCHK